MTSLIIGGTAAYHLNLAEFVPVSRTERLATPFGTTGPVQFFEVSGERCAFLARHGGEGRLGVTPPFINYHANLYAGRLIGADRVLSWNSAGSLVRSLRPGSIAAVADLIDWTRARSTTYGEQGAEGPLFNPALRMALVAAGEALGYSVAPGAVYAATEGARLETAAEIDLLARCGAELVGMTLSPEVFLARELGLQYGSLCWVSNYATGVPFDGPPRRLFGPEVGALLFGIILKLLEEEGAHGR
ncbi:MAG: MTAP family purine nucleoside phosphorylase [Mycobacterium leprae]